MSSYQYRKSHCGDKTVVRSSYLHNGNSYSGKMTSLYWISPQDLKLNSLNGNNQQIWLLPYPSYCILAAIYDVHIVATNFYWFRVTQHTHMFYLYFQLCRSNIKVCFFSTNPFIFVLRHNFTAISSTTGQKFQWRYKMDCFNEQKQKCCFSGYCFHSSPYESGQRYNMATFLLSIHVSYWGTQLHYIHTVVGWCSTQISLTRLCCRLNFQLQ